MWYKKYGKKLIILGLLIFSQFIWHPIPAQASCVCNGTIKGKYTNLIPVDVGQPIRSLRQDSLKEIKDECINDNSLNSSDSCKTYINDKAKDYSGITEQSKYDSFLFEGECQPQACGTAKATGFEITKPVLSILIPDLNFSDVNKHIDDQGNIQVPWIGEYIVAIYRLLVNVASILGVILIIREGIRVILSAGGDGKVEGYKNIGRIIIGLLLAWFSYVILYNLNSSLVSIRPLSVRVVSDLVTSDSDNNNPEFDNASDFEDVVKKDYATEITRNNGPQQTPLVTNVKACSWCEKGAAKLDSATFCSQWTNRTVTPCGYTPKDDLDKFSTCDITLNGKTQTVDLLNKSGARMVVYAYPDAHKPICKAVEIALNKGYEIRFSSVYRDFSEQAKNWCEKGSAGGLRAKPGCSVHGTGLAQDIYLFKNGNQLTSIDGDLQCNPKQAQDIKTLAEIMYAADPNFRRLEAEAWHFEFRGKNDTCHLQTTEVPFCCEDHSCRDSAFKACGQGRKHAN